MKYLITTCNMQPFHDSIVVSYHGYLCAFSSTNALTGEGLDDAMAWLTGMVALHIKITHSYLIYNSFLDQIKRTDKDRKD